VKRRLLCVVAGIAAASVVATGAALGASPEPASLASAFSDPFVPQEWWLQDIGLGGAEPPGPGKPVTVIDSGLDLSHPEFAGRPNLDALNAQTTFGVAEEHGTEVSSVIGAPTNGVGIVGIYPQANLHVWDASPRAFGRGRIEDPSAVDGIEAATAIGPGVINLSWGGTDIAAAVQLAIARAVRAGSLVVAAAGNDRQNGNPAIYPASQAHVLTVAATDDQNQVAFFSSASPGMDLAAPGIRIPVADPESPDKFDLQGEGTSFAAPIVSGAAAWLWSIRPELDASQVAEILRETATDIGPPGWDFDTGSGLLNLAAALAAPAPPRDLQEPNEDVVYITAHGVFEKANLLLTSPTREGATITSWLAATDDPRDVYRIWIRPGSRVRVAAKAADGQPLAVSLWGKNTNSVREGGLARRRDLLQTGTNVATVRGSTKGFVGYAEVSVGQNRRTAYTLSVTTSASR
jgi:subtilisin family serine protease